MTFITSFPTYNEDLIENNFETINTNINIEHIEDKLNKIVEKFEEKCKYCINITESSYYITFNVDINQLEGMCKTMVEIKLFKDKNNKSIIAISKEIKEHHEWNDVYEHLIKKCKI
jgi:Na+/phosphate symporter